MHRFKYLACALALASMACGNSDTLTTPTNPDTLTIDFTDATNGPLTPNGSQTFQFATLTTGTVNAQLIALNPDGPGGTAVGLSVGIYDTITNCQRVVTKDNAQISTSVTAQATAAGNLCVQIYDATGKLPGPQTFDIRVTHP
jgi:hypothetical protein